METGKKPNSYHRSKLSNGKHILDGENYKRIEKHIENLKEIKSREDLQRVKQDTEIWLSLRDDSEGGMVSYLRKNIFKMPDYVKIIRASALIDELAIFSPFCEKFFKSSIPGTLSKFKDTLLNIKRKDDDEYSWMNINMRYGKSHEDLVNKAFFKNFKSINVEAYLEETGIYSIREEGINDIEIWVSPDGKFKLTSLIDDSFNISGSWEAKTKTPFLPNRTSDKYFDFNRFIKAPVKITYYYVMQVILEMYSTNSEYAMIGFHSMFNGTTFFLIERSEFTDKLRKLIFKCLNWKYSFYKNFGENDKISKSI